ncbi:MAG: hypothetical protein CVT98_08925 [Bacteroidetes bacterium HGW-Bacteroidetes-15]|nr:MAG: hypothetical protein CVT98_08925 [Bacteroidetes bacterium HGW-Bacteroidetes-15]
MQNQLKGKAFTACSDLSENTFKINNAVSKQQNVTRRLFRKNNFNIFYLTFDIYYLKYRFFVFHTFEKQALKLLSLFKLQLIFYII